MEVENSNAEQIRACIKRGGHAHLLGVCGVGLAGVGLLLKSRGVNVSGCDLSRNPLRGWLEEQGIPVRDGHHPAHLTPEVDWVIRSAAVPETDPELAAAVQRGLPVFRRGEVLPVLLEGRGSIAVCGTHGKTTTTTFTTCLLESAGLAPGWCIGGEGGGASRRAVAGAGGGTLLVVEADESDGTLALYRPEISIVTNIEFDHMEHFASVRAFEDCFRTLVRNTGRRVLYCCEDPRAVSVCASYAHATSYGFSEQAAVRALDVAQDGERQSFNIRFGDGSETRVQIPVPGRHNILNALAAAAAGRELGLSPDQIREGLSKVSLPRRRFERVVDAGGVQVISDYAHHPSEIAALIRTARQLPHRRLLAVFQPHRYTRTLALGADFPAAFDGISRLVLTPVYAASEAPLKGGTMWDLYARIRELRPALWCAAAGSLAQAWEFMRRELQPGDVLLIVGAGSVEALADWARNEFPGADASRSDGDAALARELGARLTDSEVRVREPLAARTTYRVGGAADVWVEVGSEADLACLLAWAGARSLPVRVFGAGSNLLVSDLGVRGITLRLAGECFRRIERREEVVVVGAAVPLNRVLAWAEEQGLFGLEFWEGIPGTVGGAVRMNAGAWGGATVERLEWIRYLNPDGSSRIVRADALNAGYRACPGLDGKVAVEAAFRMEAGRDPAESRTLRAGYRAKREWMRGKRTAGSVFRNPQGDYAGRLIESAGLKGWRVGGAGVSSEHANVIETIDAASGSDVQALVERVRTEVRDRARIDLAPEIVIWE